MEKLFNLLFPKTCLYCGLAKGSLFCISCLEKAKKLKIGYCLVCDRPSIFGVTHIKCVSRYTPVSVYSPFVYQGAVRDCIKRSKYNKKEFSALKELTVYSIFLAHLNDLDFYNHIVMPIPLSDAKQKTRGFNQALLIANILAQSYCCSVDQSSLKRVKNTTSQYLNSKINRLLNLQNAFEVNAGHIKGKDIVLVDDICTTGATFKECCKVLLQNGANSVKCFAVCKKPKDIFVTSKNFAVSSTSAVTPNLN